MIRACHIPLFALALLEGCTLFYEPTFSPSDGAIEAGPDATPDGGLDAGPRTELNCEDGEDNDSDGLIVEVR